MGKVKRRRLLTDALALGGVLLGASVIMQPRPFWSHFLEGQKESPPPPGSPEPLARATPPTSTPTPTKPVRVDAPVAHTKAYPSDSDVHAPDVTEAYPSDSDLHERRPEITTQAYPSDSDLHDTVTKAYPSDQDAHAPRPGKSPEGKKQSLLPLWMRLS